MISDLNKKINYLGLPQFNRITLVLIILIQFQNILGYTLKTVTPMLSHAVFLVDKVFFWILLALFLYVRLLGGCLTGYRRGRKKPARFIPVLKNELIFFLSLAIFGLWCFFSGALNQNSFPVTIFGAFAYLVYCGVFFIYSSLPYPKDLIRRSYFFLLRFALFMSVISIAQELLAFAHPVSVDWWWNIQKGTTAAWRFGLFRAPSLLGHSNTISIFALFFLTVELARLRASGFKKGWWNIALLTLAIVFSLSRNAFVAAAIAGFLLLIPWKRVVLLSILIFVICFILFLVKEARITTPAEEDNDIAYYHAYRKYCLEKSLQIFRDHPFAGVGPGMYGGHISIKFNSPVYSNYGFDAKQLKYLKTKVGSIEQQWVQALAEVGGVGMALLMVVIFTPVYILSRILKEEKDLFLRSLIGALMVMPVLMSIYMLGFTVTQLGIWLVPYYFFVGALVGSRRREMIGSWDAPGSQEIPDSFTGQN